MSMMRLFYIGLGAGLVIGWFWGFLEGAGHLAAYLGRAFFRHGSFPPFDLLDVLAIPLLAAALYSLVLAPLGAVLTASLAWLFRRLPGKLALTEPREIAIAACVSGVLFFNLYWWTRPLLFYGLRFYDPRRIATSAGFALVSLLLAILIVKRLGRGKEGPARSRLLPVCLLLFAFVLAGLFQLREGSLALGGSSTLEGDLKPNVVLLVPDALRADHLGCYGYDPYDKPVSPFLDRFAEESVLFEKAVTQAPYTWTSFGSFLTGKYPRKHGLLKMDPTQRLDPQDNITLPEILKEQGYTCGAFLMGTLSNNSGLLQGFDVYFEAIVGHDPVSVHSKWSIFKSDLVIMRLYNKIKQARDPALVNTLAREFIREVSGRPFFLMVHYYATHTPYDPPEPYKSMFDPNYDGIYDRFTQSHNVAIMDGRLTVDDRDLEHITALYDGGAAFEDAMVGDLYATLEEEGVLDNTLIIFTSDHGEELYDHQVFEHDWMFNTNQLVPLIIRFPRSRFAGRRVSAPVGLIDIVPTVAEVAGFPLPGAVQSEVDGRSLLRHLTDPTPEGMGRVHEYCENNRYISVQDGAYKLIRNRWRDEESRDRFFDLVNDPEEKVNLLVNDGGEKVSLSGPHAEAYEGLSAILTEFDLSMPENTKTYQADPELQKRLIELGYIGGNQGFEEDLKPKNKQ